MPHHFAPSDGLPTVPGAASAEKTVTGLQHHHSLNQHYDSTMRQVQMGMEDGSKATGVHDTVSGALSPTVTAFDSKVDHSFLPPDTLSGALSSQISASSTQQADWLRKAELLNGGTGDTISAAGPDSLRHMENISVQGNPYFINGTLQDTIRAVGVTVSGGATPLSDTIHAFGHNETAPFNSYSPLPLKDETGNLLYPKEGILPEGYGKDALRPLDSDKNALLDPHHKVDNKASLVDLLHQVDHQVTIDLGKHSGVSSAEELSKVNSFNPDNLKNSAARKEEAIFGKTDDSLITMLDEEQKKRMATNINLPGPFGGNH